jgi:alcohol dehydrogenase
LADCGKYEKIYQYISQTTVPAGSFTTDMLVEKIRELNHSLGIPGCLREVGVDREQFQAMAEDAMKSGNIQANPRVSAKQDIVELYEKSF